MPDSHNQPLLEVENLEVGFRVSRGSASFRPALLKAVDGVSMHIARGETLGLVGQSGSGKSTTARAILQLVAPTAGSVKFEDVELSGAGRSGQKLLRRRAQMVFQDPFGSLNPRLKVDQIIREPLEIHGIGDKSSRLRRITELLDLVSLPKDAAGRYPHEFSGGQRQRIGIARALAIEPSLIVCDEPVAALDVSVQAQILQLLKEVQRETGVAYLFIAHDLNVIQYISQRTMVMYLGKVVEQGPSRTIFNSPHHPYAQALSSAIPTADPDSSRNRLILNGEIPSRTDPPSGCRFRTRCPHARERCAIEEPKLEPVADGVSVACHFWREIEAENN